MANEKFAVREIVDIVFKAKSDIQIGNTLFKKGEPVIYFDSAKTSTVESSTATVYAQGGRGNARLLAWEGDRTVTFTFEEAMLSSLGFSILSGANLIEHTRVSMHFSERVEVSTVEVTLGDTATPVSVPVLDLTSILPKNGLVVSAAEGSLKESNGSYKYPNIGVYVMELDENGSIVKRIAVNQEGALKGKPTVASLSTIAESSVSEVGAMPNTTTFQLASAYVDGSATKALDGELSLSAGKVYLVDYYVFQPGASMTVTPGKFAGNYLIEANTLFRRADGRDLPAQFTIPNGKINSAFTFTMAPTGDPSTFPFTVDAFPDYLPFNRKCKALFSLDIADEPVSDSSC